MLVPFTFERGREGAFTVEVRSSGPCELQMLPSVHSAMRPPQPTIAGNPFLAASGTVAADCTPLLHSGTAPPQPSLNAGEEEDEEDDDEDVWAERVELPEEDPDPSVRLAGTAGIAASKHERKHERKARQLSAAYLEQQRNELTRQGELPRPPAHAHCCIHS